MTDLHYQTKHDTPAIRAAAFELNIEPTPWLKPAPWWRDGWKVHKGKLNKALRDHLAWRGFDGQPYDFTGPLVVELPPKNAAYRHEMTPAHWYHSRLVAQRTLRRALPEAALGEYGFPGLIEPWGDPPHDLRGVQLYGALTASWDILCPSLYRITDSDDDAQRALDNWEFAASFSGKPEYPFVSPWLMTRNEPWTPRLDLLAQMCHILKQYEPKGVILWTGDYPHDKLQEAFQCFADAMTGD